jgi:pyruvate formate lyase activating enzyme
MAGVLSPAAPHPTVYWHRLDDGRVQCDACPRACRLHEGQAGVCFVRARQDDRIVLTTYGRSSGFCVDPVEKKPLHHFLPGSAVLSYGTAGCNLACRYCQNWDISKSKETDILADAASPERVAAAAVTYGCRSVAATYNDPVVFLEYADDVAAACHEVGVRAVAVTSGYVTPAARERLFAHMDAANVDLKSFREDFYRHVCGGHLQPVLDTVAWLVHETSVWVELTTLVIPGHNDTDAELAALGEWVAGTLGPDVPLHLTAFHPDFRMLDVPPTPLATLVRARERMLGAGLHFVYLGNVHDPDHAATRCAGCGEIVVIRDAYRIVGYGLDHRGRCRRCGAQLPGVFDGPVGTWGGRRLPVRLGRS